MADALLETHLNLPNRRSGKVRDLYDVTLDNGDPALLIVATDRISAFDVVLANGLPGKGIVLTQISRFWFDHFSEDVDSHLEAVVHAENVAVVVLCGCNAGKGQERDERQGAGSHDPTRALRSICDSHEPPSCFPTSMDPDGQLRGAACERPDALGRSSRRDIESCSRIGQRAR